MTVPDFPFDAVVFDLDGTLVATEQFWPQAAREGARRAFEELGLTRELPSAADWMSIVGHGLEEGFARLFPDLDEKTRRALMRACVEEEHRALAANGAAFLPGVEATLDALTARGVRMGIASNCPRSYLDQMTRSLRLDRWIPERRCLHSPGVRDKTDMIADLLTTFDTRSAVMVGDRLADRDAAWANGIPHVHLSRGYAGSDEIVECEAVIEGLDQLVERLERRTGGLESVLARLLVPSGPTVIGVTGDVAAGKGLMARDLARVLARAEEPSRHGPSRAVAVVSLSAFFRGDAARSANDPLEALLARFDLEALLATVLRPHRRGDPVDLERETREELFPGEPKKLRIRIPAGAALILEGPALLHPRLAVHVDRTLWLSVSEALSLRRLTARDAPLAGPRALEAAHSLHLPAARELSSRYPPAERATLVVDAENPIEPAVSAPRSVVGLQGGRGRV
jgi:phosphoglycolate phosphatase